MHKSDKKGMKKRVKMAIIAIFFTAFVYAGLFSSTPFINKYWLHPKIRKYFVLNQFQKGDCLSSKYWGVNPKKVIGYKESEAKSFYLLQDIDRHEHLQYIPKLEVESIGNKTSCRI